MLEEIKKRKKKSLIASILLAVFIFFGATLAFFNSTNSFTNVFHVGTYRMVTNEVFTSPDNWLPGQEIDKTVTTKNEGSTPAAVRIKLTETWETSGGVDVTSSMPNDAVIINYSNEDEWPKTGEYYYYYRILEPGETTSSLLESVTLNPSLGNITCTSSNNGSTGICEATTPVAGKTYKLTITIETAQYDKYQDIWNTQVEVYRDTVIPDKVACEMEVGEENNTDVYYIDSPSDLYAFSKSVNGGNNYNNKIVRLRNNLDMSKYTLEEIKSQCDDNEITGFEPIGTDYIKPFVGTFEGGGKTISNLTINKPNSDNVGLFGYYSGWNTKIYGLNLDNITVIGRNNVAALIGEVSSYSRIQEIHIKGANITGNSNVGGIFGYNSDHGSQSSTIIEDITINSTTNSYINSTIVINADVTNTNNSLGVTYYSNNTKLNNVVQSDGFSVADGKDINFYESINIDTLIGGDNDGSGYYFDYNPRGQIAISSEPINFNLPGSGTSDDPYLIRSENDWKLASTRTGGIYYKLNKNLDFSRKKFYMLGSRYQQAIKGLNGGAHFISNVTLNASLGDYISIVPKIEYGQIYGLNVDNVKVTGNNYVAGVCSYPSFYSSVYEIALNNGNITGNSYVGSIYSTTYEYSYAYTNLVKKVNIAGNSYVYANDTYNTSSITENADLTYTNSGSMGNTYYSNISKINNVTQTDGFDSSNIDDLEYYSGIIETSYNGDSNNSGYYFDYVYSKGGVYLVDKNDTSNTPPYTPISDNDNTSSSGNCTITYGSWTNLCSQYISGMHGGYQYRQYTGNDSGVGGACTGTGLNAAQRRKVNYSCN